MHKKFLSSMAIFAMAATQLGAQETGFGPEYTKDGSVVRPVDWETWVFVGSPLTPNALNGGQASFQQFHSVYIEPEAFEHFKRTGEFANGTQLAKVRTHLYRGDDCGDVDAENGSCQAVSGRGYFNGEYSGFELTVKDTTRFDDPGGWVYYNFGETPAEWKESAQPFPAASCNSCHASAAANDFVFTQFYPVLRASEPRVSDSRPKAGSTTKAAVEQSQSEQQPAVDSPLPTDRDSLFKHLQSGEYKTMGPAEEAVHPSAGPHITPGMPVKVYFSDALAQSLAGKFKQHPKGSAVVKELYNDSATEVTGWAVAIKTDEESANGRGWFWVEFLSTTDPSKIYENVIGNGVSECTGCHRGGRDFVISRLP
ncbi:hypothetical protein NBRC116590_17180 [Pelagimonas sp. KU-00592-HH]|uniref:cytochrome P460 family protein n=1 Tax=Pelagimonas sp. KU-00592-HH TaxID=3127651 RepID=UPI003109210D